MINILDYVIRCGKSNLLISHCKICLSVLVSLLQLPDIGGFPLHRKKLSRNLLLEKGNLFF